VRTSIIIESSREVATASGSGFQKLGQPVPLSNFVFDEKSGRRQPVVRFRREALAPLGVREHEGRGGAGEGGRRKEQRARGRGEKAESGHHPRNVTHRGRDAL
jgi:hypothetical protein